MNDPDEPRIYKMSGRQYVSTLLKEEGEMSRFALRVVIPKHCKHQNTVCVNCLKQWAWDHVLDFDRTEGGRKLKAAWIKSEAEKVRASLGKPAH